jgi:ribosomal protein S14
MRLSRNPPFFRRCSLDLSKAPANLTYTRHRNSCYFCGAVDLGFYHMTRCAEGRRLVRAAATEGRMMRWKLKLTAKDIVLLREMKILL